MMAQSNKKKEEDTTAQLNSVQAFGSNLPCKTFCSFLAHKHQFYALAYAVFSHLPYASTKVLIPQTSSLMIITSLPFSNPCLSHIHTYNSWLQKLHLHLHLHTFLYFEVLSNSYYICESALPSGLQFYGLLWTSLTVFLCCLANSTKDRPACRVSVLHI